MRAYRVLIGTILALLACLPVTGQDTESEGEQPATIIAEDPLAITWYTGFTASRMLQYAKSVIEELGFEAELPDHMHRSFEEEIDEDEKRPVRGTVFLLKKGLPPEVETVNFRLADDRADAEQTLKSAMDAYRENYGGDRTEEITTDGSKHTLQLKWERKIAVRETVQVEQDDGTTKSVRKQKLDESGKPVFRTSVNTSEFFFRQLGEVVYDTESNGILDAELPESRLLRSNNAAAKDAAFAIYVDNVPGVYKDVGWSMLNNVAGTILQQQDDELEFLYDFRKSVGDCGLQVVEMLIKDVVRIDGSLRFASAARPLIAHAEVRSRKGSQLSRSARAIGALRPLLPVNDDAIVTLHSVWAIPKSLREVCSNFFEVVRQESSGGLVPSDWVVPIEWITNSLDATVAKARFEFMSKIGGTVDSGPAFYGALRAESPDDLFAGIISLLEVSGAFKDLREVESEAGTYYWSMEPPLKVGKIAGDVRPKRLWLTAGPGAVWFALGGNAAWKIIEDRLLGATENRAVRARSGSIVSLNVDLRRLASDDPDDEKLVEFAKEMELVIDRWLTEDAEKKALAYAKKHGMRYSPARTFVRQIAERPESKLTFRIDSGDDGLFAHCEISESIGSLVFGRLMQSELREEAIRDRISKTDEARKKEKSKAKEKPQS